MEQFKLTVTRFPRTKKPNITNEWFELSDVFASELTFEEFTTLIGECGHSFTHAVCDGDIRYKHFQFSQLLVLDIDNKKQVFHPAQALERLRMHGLQCNAIYVTFNNPTDPSLPDEEQLEVVERYRMIFILDNPVENIDLFKQLLKHMYALFPEADRCHATQVWAGGKHVIYRNPDFRLVPMDLIHVTHLKETESVKSKRKTKKFTEKIAALPQAIFHQGKKNANDSNVPKNANCNTSLIQPAEIGTSPVRNFNWGAARSQSKLLDDFLGAKRKVLHYELFGLYTAMKRIEGGRKLWRECITQNPEINDDKIIEIGSWIDKWEELGRVSWEKPLQYYVPEDDPVSRKYYRLTDIHFSRQKEARQIESQYHMPLPDAQWAFRYMFHEVKGEIGKGVYVFKCATGLGKTEELMRIKLDECVIAVPTHRLKEELSRRMKAAGIRHVTIPELPSGLPVSIQQKYEAFLAVGSFNYAAGYLRSLDTDKLVEAGLPLEEAKSLDIQLMRYFNRIKIATESTYPVLTTHKRIAHTDFPNHSTIIFDEDIIETIGEVKTVAMRDIRLILKQFDEHSMMHQILSRLLMFSSDSESIGVPLTRSQVIDEDEMQSIAIGQSVTEELLMAGVRSEIISMLKFSSYGLSEVG